MRAIVKEQSRNRQPWRHPLIDALTCNGFQHLVDTNEMPPGLSRVMHRSQHGEWWDWTGECPLHYDLTFQAPQNPPLDVVDQRSPARVLLHEVMLSGVIEGLNDFGEPTRQEVTASTARSHTHMMMSWL